MKKLGFWQQIAITFFIVSGGPYGLESAVASVGAAWTLLLIFIIPIFWAIPTGLMVSELSSIVSEQGGYYVWVRRSMGKFWGFQEGWWTLCYSAVDLAIYPVLFISYLSYFYPELNHPSLLRFLLCAIFVSAALIMNLNGSRFVGMNKIGEVIFVSIPFLLFIAIGFFKGSWELSFHAVKESFHQAISPSQLAAGLSILIWNFTGWDNATTYADEIHEPTSTIPKTVFFAIFFVFVSYFFPLIIAYKTSVDPKLWGESSGWPEIIARACGPWLGTFTAVAAIVSAWALFNSQLLYIARIPTAMAKDGIFPKNFTKTFRKTNAPTISLLACAVCAIVFSALSLGKLMILDILLYSLALSLEFIALVLLRKKEPNTKRQFRIPLPTWGLVCMSLAPMSLAIVVALSSLLGDGGSFLQIGISSGAILSGVILYFFFK